MGDLGSGSRAYCKMSCTWSLKRQAPLPSRDTTRFSILVLSRIWHALRVHGQSARTAANARRLAGKTGLLMGCMVGKMHPLSTQTRVTTCVSPMFCKVHVGRGDDDLCHDKPADDPLMLVLAIAPLMYFSSLYK